MVRGPWEGLTLHLGAREIRDPRAAFCLCIPAVPVGLAVPAVFLSRKRTVMPPLLSPEDATAQRLPRGKQKAKAGVVGPPGGP